MQSDPMHITDCNITRVDEENVFQAITYEYSLTTRRYKYTNIYNLVYKNTIHTGILNQSMVLHKLTCAKTKVEVSRTLLRNDGDR